MNDVSSGVTTPGLVYVVLVNWNGWSDTVDCLESLSRVTYSPVRAVVVDNGSRDDSVKQLRSHPSAPVVLEAGRNLGFAGGCNLGIRHALQRGAEFVWLLNNDTVVRPDALSTLVEMANAHPDCDVFGSWIGYYSQPERLWFGGGTFSAWTGRTAHAHHDRPSAAVPGKGRSTPTDWITGCSLLARAEAIERVGMLDESFFLYAEELEWQLRAGAGRPRAMIHGDTLVLHKVGQSTGSTDGYLGRLFMARNHVKIATRYSGLAMPLWLTHWAWQYVALPALKRDPRGLRAAVEALRSQQTEGAEIVERLRGRARAEVTGG